MYFGETVVININSCFSEEVENNFLTESLTSDIQDRIAKLRSKDISELKKEDFEKILKDIYSMEDRKAASKVLVTFFAAIVGCIIAMIGADSNNLKMSFVGFLISFINTINIEFITSESSAEKIMRNLMKLEAKLNKEKEKADSDLSKEIDKDLEIVKQFKSALKRYIHKFRYVQNEAFRGNDIKNDIYRQVLDETETLISTFVQTQKFCFEIAEKQLKEFEKAKNFKTLNNAAVNIREIGINGNKQKEEIQEEMCGDLTWAMFRKDSKKLRNAMSIVSFNNKRDFAKKITNIQKDMNNQAKKYYEENSDFVKRLNKVYKDTQKINIELADRCYNVIISWINYAMDDMNATNNDIEIALKELDLQRSTNSFIFKLLNGKELLKSMKDED